MKEKERRKQNAWREQELGEEVADRTVSPPLASFRNETPVAKKTKEKCVPNTGRPTDIAREKGTTAPLSGWDTHLRRAEKKTIKGSLFCRTV